MKAYTQPEVEYVQLTSAEEIMSAPSVSQGYGTVPWETADNRDNSR